MFGWFINKGLVCIEDGPDWCCEICSVWQESSLHNMSCVACGGPRPVFFKCRSENQGNGTNGAHVHKSRQETCDNACNFSVVEECFELKFDTDIDPNRIFIFICQCGQIDGEISCQKCGSVCQWKVEKWPWFVSLHTEESTENDASLALALSEEEDDELKKAIYLSLLPESTENLTEKVQLHNLPYWCACGWLNSRKSQPVSVSILNQTVCRMWCSHCKEERNGYWTCEKCTYENKVNPFDFQTVPKHQCAVCNVQGFTITIRYNGASLDLLTEAYLIWGCEKGLQLSFLESKDDCLTPFQESQLNIIHSVTDIQSEEMVLSVWTPTGEQILSILEMSCEKNLVDRMLLWLILRHKLSFSSLSRSCWVDLSHFIQRNPTLVSLGWWMTTQFRESFQIRSLFLFFLYWVSDVSSETFVYDEFLLFLCSLWDEKYRILHISTAIPRIRI